MGTDCFQCVRRRPSPRSVSSCSSPLATTWYLAGAMTMNSLVALSYGWSIIGSHWRALFGQFSLKNTRSPNLFFSIRSPLAGTPRYRTVIVRSSPARGAAGRSSTSRSASCLNGTTAPADVTSATVIPLPLAADARSSATVVTPAPVKRRRMVAVPAISSLSSPSVS